MKKLTDFELFSYGMLEQNQTWWGKKILANEEKINAEIFGKVLKTWQESSGDFDGVKLPHFIVLKGDFPKHIYANESGIYELLKSGGAGLLKEGGAV